MRGRTRVVVAVAGVLVAGGAFAAGALAPDLLRDDRGEVPGTQPAADVLDEVGGGDDVFSEEDDVAPDDGAAGPPDEGPGGEQAPDDEEIDGAEGEDGTEDGAVDGTADLALPGWLAIVRSLTLDGRTAEEASAEAAALEEAGVDDVQVLRSDDLAGLEPGFWVLHAGGGWPEDGEQDAVATCERVAPVVDCYIRRVDTPAP